jgi:hypothetical protein
MELNKALHTNDQVVCSGIVAYAGTLAVTNLAGTLAPGDQFALFSAAGGSSGNFSSISGSSGTVYSFNPTNGVLSVVSVPATNPVNIAFSASGGALTLSWPPDHLGWILQSQTNSLNRGLSTNWVDIGTSGSSTQAVYNVNPKNPAVFYRLRSPGQ